LDVCVVRKLGVPGHEELAMGAIASGGVRVVHEASLRSLGLDEELLEAVAKREHREVERRERLFRGARPALNLQGRCVIVVDDGLATGATMRAAIQAIRQAAPKTVVMAVPVGSPDVVREFESLVDEVVCVAQPYPFFAVGVWYRRFGQVTDDQVVAILEAETLVGLAGTRAQEAAAPRSLP
ncbi:MAG: phosphoribosyltransferase, partial [Myxococcota bacterium]